MLALEVELKRGQKCLIKSERGGYFFIVEGLLEIFGMQLGAGEKIYVPIGRVFPILVIEDSKLILENCDLVRISEDLFPPEWFKTIERILNAMEDKKNLSICVLGYTDVGKSSLILLLTNKLVKKGYTVGILDADIGQSKIGPPGVIGAAIIRHPVLDLSDIPMEVGYFIGDKTPEGHLLPQVIGVSKLFSFLRNKCDAILIDTTGMVHGGPARALKLYKVDNVHPDFLIILEKYREAEHLVKLLQKSANEIIRLPSPKTLKSTARPARIALRTYSFKKFVKTAHEKTIEVKFSDISLQECVLGTGYPIPNPAKVFEDVTILWAEVSPDIFLIITREPKHLHAKEELTAKARRLMVSIKTLFIASRMNVSKETIKHSPILSKMGAENVEAIAKVILRANITEIPIRIIPKSVYENLYIGLLNKSGDLIAVGILKDIDFQHQKMLIKALFFKSQNDIAIIRMGYLKLNDNWEEIGKRRIGVG